MIPPAEPSPPARGWRPVVLGLEFAVIYGGLPLAAWLWFERWGMFLVLWSTAAVCLAVLLWDRRYPSRRLWETRRLARNLRSVLPVFAAGAVLLTALTLLLVPDRLFGFVRHRPGLWALVMVLYPLLSVYPQGIVYRAFLFHRYAPLFPRPWQRLVAGGAAFSLMHLVFGNPVAPALTLLGGLLFGRTYERTGSLLVSNIEQSAYGCFIFTIGLGVYFYGGGR